MSKKMKDNERITEERMLLLKQAIARAGIASQDSAEAIADLFKQNYEDFDKQQFIDECAKMKKDFENLKEKDKTNKE